LEPEKFRGGRGVSLTLGLMALVFALSLLSNRPPSAKPASVPATQFSSERARSIQDDLTGDGIPHPIGSHQNDLVRQRIIDQFKRLGYDPQVQTAFDCDEFGMCGMVKNVLARLAGTERRPAVLVAAHYDSVPAGPGASDDGSGAASVLEVARALKAMPPPPHSVILMIDDGEEAGLLGARAFVDFNPWAKDVRAAVNVDARGSSGASLMFETGSANAWSVRLYAEHAPRPATNSILYTIYKTLPNDTDFTVFKAAGYQGLNFAYIGGVVQYHTPLDNMQNASPASLQHQGDNALASLVALADAPDLADPPKSEAVYSDVFGRWIARWPSGWTLPLAILALVLIAGQILWLIHKGRLTPPQLVWGVVSWIAAVLASGVIALILVRLLRLFGALPANWVAHPIPIRAAMWCIALAVVIAHAVAFAGRARFWGLWGGVWAAMAVLSVVCAWLSPGFSFIFLAGSAVAALSALPFTVRPEIGRTGALLPVILPLVTAGAAGFGVALMLYAGLGVRFLPMVAVVAAVIFAPLLPLGVDLQNATLLPRLSIPGLPIAAALGASLLAAVMPAFSAKAPERLNIEYWLDGDSGRAEWLALPDSGRLPPSLRRAAKFEEDRGPFPWSRRTAFAVNAPRLDLAPPTFTIQQSSVSSGRRAYQTLLLSERGAPEETVLFPPNSGIDSVRMEGVAIPPESERELRVLNGWTAYGCKTMPPNGVTLSFTLPEGKPVVVFVMDKTYKVPDQAKFLLEARPLTATPSQDGDVTLVSRRVELIP
jgi:Peptidase family M28